MERLYRCLPVGMLILVTAVWGWTFVVVRVAVAQYPVLPFLAVRFTLAAVFLFPFALSRGTGLAAGIGPGFALALGYGFQTWGLQHTSASKAGLLTGLMVVFTPLLEWVFYGRRPAMVTVAAVCTAFIGTALLAVGGAGLSVKRDEVFGDALEVLTAICFAVHVILLGRLSSTSSTARVAFAQMLAAAALFIGAAGLAGGIPFPGPEVWVSLFITAGLASAIAFWIQTFVQKRLSPSRTAIVLVMEPAFATLFGLLLAGDRFTFIQALGAGLILVALFGHEAIRPWFHRSTSQVAQS